MYKISTNLLFCLLHKIIKSRYNIRCKGGDKDMYYGSGNYEAFANPKKPVDVDKKSAYLIGSGLAALAAACFLVRELQEVPVMDIYMMDLDTLCVAEGRWITTLSVCGIYLDQFRQLKLKVLVY